MAGNKDDARDAQTVLTEQLWNDPETRPLIEEAVLKKYPNAVAHMPARQAAQAGEAVLAEARRVNEDTTKKLLERDQRDALERARKEVMDDPMLRIRADEMPEIEKLMLDETIGPIGTHRAAAQLYRSQQAVASPRSGGYATMQVPGVGGAGGDDYKWLVPGIGRPMELDRVTRERAETIMHDFANGRGSKWA